MKKQRKPVERNDEDSDDVYDEIDRFHNKRNQLLDMGEKRKSRQEEVLNVEGDISSDEEDVEQDEDSMFDSDSDNEKEQDPGLPSADRWGRKRQAYYNTSYVDADFGGMNESDEEIAQLEREDATGRQRKLDAALQAVCFDDDDDDRTQHTEKVAPKKREVDVDAMSEEQKLKYFLKMNPELDRMLTEYKEKREVMQSQLIPLLKILESLHTERRSVLEQQLRSMVSIYSNYLTNIMFYLRLKTTTELGVDESKRYVDEHPVIDSIIACQKKIAVVEQFLVTNAAALSRIQRKAANNKSLSLVVERSGFVDDVIQSKKSKKAQETQEHLMEYAEGHDEDGDLMGEDVYDESGQKRGITTEIEKNKGLSVKRKKGTQHSRVKKRKQFDKALIRKRSQKADIRREMKPYAGEARGIRASTVKSIKLKA